MIDNRQAGNEDGLGLEHCHGRCPCQSVLAPAPALVPVPVPVPVPRALGRWVRIVIFGVMTALWGLPVLAMPKQWTGRVMYVSDGDTLWVQPDQGGEVRKLRLAAIDAPERCQAWGLQAWQALHHRLLGQHVQVVSGRLDTYGRLLAQVWHQGQDVGAWLVAQGHAWSPHFRGMPGPYDPLQREAQWARRGVFSHPLGLMPPREFRRWHGSC